MGLQGLAGGVLGIGDLTQPQTGDIFLLGVFRKFHSAGGLSHKHRQNAGGHGVQGAAVAHPLFPQNAAQLGADIHTGPVGGLINDDDAVWHGLLRSFSGCGSAAAGLEVRCDPGNGVQHLLLGFGPGGLHGTAGCGGVAASAQQTADLGGVDTAAGADGHLPDVGPQLPHGDGTVHALDLAAQGGELLGVALSGMEPLHEGHGHGQNGHPLPVVKFGGIQHGSLQLHADPGFRAEENLVDSLEVNAGLHQRRCHPMGVGSGVAVGKAAGVGGHGHIEDECSVLLYLLTMGSNLLQP